jgi:hypothetical protein
MIENEGTKANPHILPDMQKAHGAQRAPAPQGLSTTVELGATSVRSRDEGIW